MKRCFLFGGTVLALLVFAGTSQAFGKRCGGRGSVSSGSCGVGYGWTNVGPVGSPSFTPAPTGPLPKAPSSIGGYPQQTYYSGQLQPGMWIKTDTGWAQITSVGPSTPLAMPGATTAPTQPATPPTIRKLPEPEPNTKPKAPKSEG